MRGLVMFLAVFVALAGSLTAAAADRRVALIIGNGAYEHADKLANPVTDARNLREVLKKIGFDAPNIVYGENLNKRELERAIGKFAGLARDADVALAYYAGHGATFGDTPYIVPVDARFNSLDEMPYELVSLENMIGELRKAKGVRIAIIDACRDNGAERDLKRLSARGGEITRGLAPPRNPDGLILAYATQYLSTAADGPAGGDSPFTAALLKHLPTPGLDVKDLFFEIGQDVLAATQDRQRPEVKVSFFGKYALVKADGVVAKAVDVVPLATRADTEQAEFYAAMRSEMTVALDEFVAKYKTTPLTDIARGERERRMTLATLAKEQAAKAEKLQVKKNADADAARQQQVKAQAAQDAIEQADREQNAKQTAKNAAEQAAKVAALPLPQTTTSVQGPVQLIAQGEWKKICGIDQIEKKDVCYTTRDFGIASDQPPVMAVAVYDIKGDKQKVLRMLMPVGVMIGSGFKFSFDKGVKLSGSFQTCFANGCFGEAKIETATVDSMKKTTLLNVSVRYQAGNEVTFMIPFAKFAKFFDGPASDP